jgi:hypothetical protein
MSVSRDCFLGAVGTVQYAFWLHIAGLSPAHTNGQSFYVELDKSQAKSNSTPDEKEEWQTANSADKEEGKLDGHRQCR